MALQPGTSLGLHEERGVTKRFISGERLISPLVPHYVMLIMFMYTYISTSLITIPAELLKIQCPLKASILTDKPCRHWAMKALENDLVYIADLSAEQTC